MRKTFEEILNCGDDINSRLHIGFLISNVFNDPFSLYQSSGIPKLSSANKIGVFIAPIVADFVFNLIYKLKEKSINTLLLAARDGYLIKKNF